MPLDKELPLLQRIEKSEGLVLDFSIRENLALPNLESISKSVD